MNHLLPLFSSSTKGLAVILGGTQMGFESNAAQSTETMYILSPRKPPTHSTMYQVISITMRDHKVRSNSYCQDKHLTTKT